MPSTRLTCSRKEARMLALGAQLLGSKVSHPFQAIEHLGYVQIDTIAVINRAHHHVLWTRFPAYTPDALHQMQAIDRSLFEYWGHAMSYLPMDTYRFALPRMKRFQSPSSPWAVMQLKKCQDLLQPVLARIQSEGALSVADFKQERPAQSQGWWDWKPAKVALEYLFWRGDLMISERRQFRKYYDLKNRILPASVNTSMPSRTETGNFLVSQGLRAMGIANLHELTHFLQPGSSRDSDFHLIDKAGIQQSLEAGIKRGEIQKIFIEKDTEINYCLTGAADRMRSVPSHIHILSPFDNCVIQRKRLKRLFDFAYTLECYVPQAKRQYGYFVLPILYGDRFIARMDCKADRKTKTLIIKKLVFEPKIKISEKMRHQFHKKIDLFKRFNACESIKFEQVSPQSIQDRIQ